MWLLSQQRADTWPLEEPTQEGIQEDRPQDRAVSSEKVFPVSLREDYGHRKAREKSGHVDLTKASVQPDDTPTTCCSVGHAVLDTASNVQPHPTVPPADLRP